MNLRTISARSAAIGVATVLAAGALAATTTTAADAAEGHATYMCVSAFAPDQPIPVVVSVSADLTGLPPLPTGFAAGAGTLHLPFSFTIPEAAVTGLKAAIHATKLGTSDVDFQIPFGNKTIPVEGLALPQANLPDMGDFNLAVPGEGASQGAFALPSPGKDIPVKLPTTFSMTVNTDTVPSLGVVCTIQGDSPTLATLTVIKQGSVLGKLKAPKSVKAGKNLTIVAPVSGANIPATGKVVAKEGKKVVGSGVLKKGKATIVIKKVKKSKKGHTYTISYAGDKNTNAAINPSKVFVKVKK